MEANDELDIYPVSFCVIATRTDFQNHALNMMRSLPLNAQVCVLFNEETDGEEFISDVVSKKEEQRTLLSRVWKYKKGQFDFATARNLCHEMATKDWVFWIDCDEMIAHAQHAGIAEATNAGGGVGGYMCGQASLTNYGRIMYGGNAEYVNTPQCRLYRNTCGFDWVGYAHEQIVPSIQDAGYTLIESTIIVIHNGYSGDYDTLYAKLERNASLIGRWLHEHGTQHKQYKHYRDVWHREMDGLIKMEKKKCPTPDM